MGFHLHRDPRSLLKLRQQMQRLKNIAAKKKTIIA